MGAPASQVQCTIRHCRTECEHTKERWIASQSAFLMFTLSEWMDEWKDSSLFFKTVVFQERHFKSCVRLISQSKERQRSLC